MIDALPPRAGQTAIVVGSGPSLRPLLPPAGSFVVACNRAIEVVPADYWIWVDRIHYERSKWLSEAALFAPRTMPGHEAIALLERLLKSEKIQEGERRLALTTHDEIKKSEGVGT